MKTLPGMMGTAHCSSLSESLQMFSRCLLPMKPTGKRFEWVAISSTERLHLLEGNDDLAWRRRMVPVEEKSLTGAREESLSKNNTSQVDGLSPWLQDHG
jgi:hypothetical protein